jgi:ESS family glutamate:Na+ symporter
MVVVVHYWLPLLVISVVVSVATWLCIEYVAKNSFSEYGFERFAAIFGNMTGTMQSALVLLRIVDSGMKSPASYNLVYGSGLALVFGFPLLLLINAPVNYFENPTEGFWVVMFALIAYLFLLGLAWQYLKRNGGD